MVDLSHTSLSLQWDPAGEGASATEYRVVAVNLGSGARSETMVAHERDEAHNLTLANVSYAAVYRLQVFAVVDGYSEETGSNQVLLSSCVVLEALTYNL